MDIEQSVRQPVSDRCCGSDLSVVALTRDDPSRSRVELLRCTACGQSRWRLDGTEVSKDRALGALSAAYAPATPARKATPIRSRPRQAPEPAAAPAAKMSDLLAGWQVLGSH